MFDDLYILFAKLSVGIVVVVAGVAVAVSLAVVVVVAAFFCCFCIFTCGEADRS